MDSGYGRWVVKTILRFGSRQALQVNCVGGLVTCKLILYRLRAGEDSAMRKQIGDNDGSKGSLGQPAKGSPAKRCV